MTTTIRPDLSSPAASDPAARPASGLLARLVRGRAAVLVLLAGTALLYLVGLGRSGWANGFYSAAAQAGSTSWKALFFGSFDGGNAITVDKTPAAIWLMALSVKTFGLSSWSVLVPQALAGVASVGLLHASVRRWFGPVAGLIAGAVLATTPVATLMFRFNNPDALLVLLLVAGAYAVTRALERGSTRWLALAGACVGFGFLTKMLQALLVLPAFGIGYLVAAPVAVRRRLAQLGLATLAMLGAAGWWVAIVALWPAGSRPYIGGSQHNSILELTLGYNGFGRLTGDETGSVGGRNGWGQAGWTRLLGAEIGGQVAWLLPAALVLLAAGLWLVGRAPREDRTRGALLLWGGWLLVTAVTFSFMRGIFHPYYTVALAPAVGAVVGIGAVVLWRGGRVLTDAVLGLTVAGTAWWCDTLLGRSTNWYPWLKVAVLVTGVVAGAGLIVRRYLPRPVAAGLAVGALSAVLAGPAAYAVDTAATVHTGAIPSAGPVVAGAFGPGGRGAFAGPGGFRARGNGGANGGGNGGGNGGFAPPAGAVNAGRSGGNGGAGPGGGMGGLLDTSSPSSDLVTLLTSGSSGYRWAAATVGSNNAAGYQLATRKPVMSIGGFNGSDPSPTLAQFQQYVAQRQIHYFISSGLGAGPGGFGPGGGFGGPGGAGGGTGTGGSDDPRQIGQWVAQRYPARTVGGVTVYDLSS